MSDVPALLFVIGPPAVGKMTVGAEIARRTGYKLFHNHMTVEPLLRLFPYGSPQFSRLNDEIRARILEEAANSDIPGQRNISDSRLAEKPSKQDLEWSRQHLLQWDEEHRMNSDGEFDGRADHLLVENSDLAPGEVAARAIEFFGL